MDGEMETEISAMGKRIDHNHRQADKKLKWHYQEDFEVATPTGLKKRGKHRPKLSTEDKIEIAFRIIKGLEMEAELAREYQVTVGRISQIVTAVRKKPKTLDEMISKDQKKTHEAKQLADFLKGLIASGKVVERAADVVELFKEKQGA